MVNGYSGMYLQIRTLLIFFIIIKFRVTKLLVSYFKKLFLTKLFSTKLFHQARFKAYSISTRYLEITRVAHLLNHGA